MDIRTKIDYLNEKIRNAAICAGSVSEGITIVAVTKAVDESKIQEVLNCGLRDLGENRVQDFCSKWKVIGDEARWHLVGTLQTNKVKYIIDKVHLIHSLDRIALAEELDLRARQENKHIDTLVQVNVSEEETKHGLKCNELEKFLEKISCYPSVHVKGLMTIAPFSTEPSQVHARRCFFKLRELFDQMKGLKQPNVEMCYLSMGMSDDYVAAIEEGSNMIRVGRAIFNE